LPLESTNIRLFLEEAPPGVDLIFTSGCHLLRTPVNIEKKGREDRFGMPLGVGLGLREVLARGLAYGVAEAATPGLHERERDGVRRAAVGTSQADV
jgi:hypothetical protein